MKKFILKLDLHDDKEKRKAMKVVSLQSGIDIIAMDMKGKKMTVIGTVDPVSVACKLRKYWPADILFVGPAKEPEKKEEPKKEEPKKEEPKKEEGKKDGEGKKEEEKKGEEKKGDPPKKDEEKKPAAPLPQQPMLPPMFPFRQYYPPVPPQYNVPPPMYAYPPPMMHTYHPPPSQQYFIQPSVEENPSGCVIS